MSLAVLENLLARYVSSGMLTVLLNHRPVKALALQDSVRSLVLRNQLSGLERTVNARYFLDATEQGDLLPLTGTEFVTGAESHSQTGEPHAPPVANPHNIQSFYCMFRDGLLEG